jgi:hypothetical protein
MEPLKNSLHISQVSMLPPHMLCKLVFSGIPRSVTFRACKNGTQMKSERLIDTMGGSFMTDTVRVSVESDGTAVNVTWNTSVSSSDYSHGYHSWLNCCR